MEWYIDSRPYFRPNHCRPSSKRARRLSVGPDCEDEHDEQATQNRQHDSLPREQYQDKWDELAQVRAQTEANTQRIKEIDDLVHSFGAYKMYDVPAPTSYFENFEVQNSYFDKYEIPRRSYEMPTSSYGLPTSSYGMPTSSYDMGRSSCVVRPTYMENVNQQQYNEYLGTAIDQESQPVQTVSSPCGAIITDEHFHTPEIEPDAPMEESEEPQAPPRRRRGLMERWASKATLTPWSKKR